MTCLSGLLNNGTAVCIETADHQETNIQGMDVYHVNVTPNSVQRALELQESLVADAVFEVSRNLGGPALKELKYTPEVLIDLVEDQILVAMAQQLTWRIRGRVALYVCPSSAYDEEAIVQKAKLLVFAAERSSIARSRLFVSIPATWEGIQAAKRLKTLFGIECNMTMVVTVVQAMACAQAGVAYISPPVGQIQLWNQNNNDSPFYNGDSIQGHSGINFVKRMAQIFTRNNYQTKILPYDFRTIEEVIMLAGHPMVCLPLETIKMLDGVEGPVTSTMDQVRGISHYREPDYYSNKSNFQTASEAEKPERICDLVNDMLRDMETPTGYVRSLVNRYLGFSTQ